MSDPVRAAFEAWFEVPPYGWDADTFRRAAPIGVWPSAYARYETEISWEAWQASRAAALEEAAATVAAMIISPTDIILCADTIDEAAARIRKDANESNRLLGERCETLETLLGELFQWCEDNVPYFGEAAKGSYDEAVYRRVAKALGNEYTGNHPEPARE